MQGKWIALTTAIVVVAGGWTGGWFWLRDRVGAEMDRAFADLAADGVEVTCPDRSITGWPFRIEVACVHPTARLPDGSTVTAAALSAIGVVDDPYLVRIALAAPVTAAGADGSTVAAGFESLAASLRHDGTRLVRLSVAADKLDAEAAPAGGIPARVVADHGEFHARPAETAPDDVDLALTLAGTTATLAGNALLPVPADAGIAGVLRQAPLLGGDPDRLRAWSAAGGEIGLTEAALELGETRIEAKGTASIAPDGQPKAAITATATRIDWLTGQAKAGKPLPPVLATLGTAFLLLGRKAEGEGDPRVLEITVGDGAATANGLPLGGTEPLF
jgi:hypothetical protein